MTIDTKALRELQANGLSGHWRHGHGFICCGTLRVARADFDTNPPAETMNGVLDQLCGSANALPDLLDRLAALEADTVLYCPECTHVGEPEGRCCPGHDKSARIPRHIMSSIRRDKRRIEELEGQLHLANVDVLQTEAERSELEAESQRLQAGNLEAVRAFGRGAQRIGTARIVEIVKERMPHVDDRYANEVAGRFHALPSGFANTFSQDVADALIAACLECGATAAKR